MHIYIYAMYNTRYILKHINKNLRLVEPYHYKHGGSLGLCDFRVQIVTIPYSVTIPPPRTFMCIHLFVHMYTSIVGLSTNYLFK